jgi:ABC-type microcin C transport system duplicated ATPase subunit YejF
VSRADLKIDFVAAGADIVGGIVLDVRAGGVLGLVGEWASGKATREPPLLVCDEATSAHLALIRTIAARVVVMTDGTIVESGPTLELLDAPDAEYTGKLLANARTVEAALSR